MEVLKMKIQNVRLKLIRENIGEYNSREFNISSPQSVVEVMNNVFDFANDTVENFCCMFLDTKHKVIGLDVIGRGVVDGCLVSPRDVIQKALMVNASALIISHNHPSANTKPSNDDIAVTDRIRKACDIMGIRLLDHIIVGDTNYNYYSFKEQGLIS